MLLIDLPSEVLLLILSHLNIHQILSLRQTCSTLATVTRDRGIWLKLLQQQERKLPLPLALRAHDSPARMNLSSSALENIVTSNSLVDELWSLPRQSEFRKLEPKIGSWLLGLETFLDRWVFAIYGDGYLNVWDLEGEGEGRWANSTYTGHYSSHTSTFDEKNLVLTLAVVASGTFTALHRTVVVYEIQLSATSGVNFKVISTFPLENSYTIRRIEFQKRFLVFSHLCTIIINRWNDRNDDISEFDSCNVRTYIEEREEMYTTIHSVELAGPYMLVLKTRSVEVHPLPLQFCATKPSRPLPILRHDFRTYSFRDFRLGEVEKTGDCYIVKFLASDVVQGLFYFSSTITIPSDPQEDPSLRIDLLYVYPIAPTIRVRRLTTHDNVASSEETTERLVLHTGHVRSPFFVSAFAMGSQGMRGVWIERRRGTMAKHIVTCRFNIDMGEEEEEERDVDGSDVPIFLDGRVVHTFKSFNLNEDLMHCVFGEIGGMIIVGNRSGEVLLLDIGASVNRSHD
ncbi:hypothetical protein L218DRAFT_745280 [Marasmius fiardii PR-910]|nr:hypothetical protein L218DRAFT_745280 [Marasmius fiardii PR-910]